MVARGEVWLARLDPTEGREIQKTRPCLVISPPEIHDYLDTILAAPLTSGSYPARYRIATRFNEKDNLILLEQIRVLDKRRLLRLLGRIESKTLSSVLTTLQELFAEE